MNHRETRNIPPPTEPVRADTGEGEARARFAFLAETSRLLAETLDYETTLVTVAGLALPHLGAWCIVDVIEPDGSMQRLAVLHPDPAKQTLARELHRRYPPGPDDAIGAPRVMRTAQPEIVAEVMDSDLARAARDPEHRALLRELGMRALLTVPMLARGRMVGAMTFVGAEGGHGLGPSDLLLAEDLAGRCAMAIDNARLHAEARAAREAADSATREARTAARETAAVNERLVVASLRAQDLAEDAHAANRAKSAFLATMSHEIRTPINAIVGYADLLEMGISGPVTEQQKAHLERIKAASSHLLMLVDDILDLAKVEAGHMTIRRESASMADAIAAAIALMHTRAAADGIEIEDLGADGDEPCYAGDEQRVRQILVNLLSNAVKFTDPGGRVTVRRGITDRPDPDAQLRGEGPWTYIRVEDTGLGIAPEHAATIFEPFMQVETGHTRTHDGTGLGLAIACELAERMSGDLTLRSELGAGSCFTLWLPAGSAAVPSSGA